MDYTAARMNMVEGQIRTNKVTDAAVVAAISAVPRERFVPDAFRGAAYVDEDLPVGGGRYLLEPMVLARLLQAAAVGPDARVLDVACATGYSTAVLGRLAGRVIGLECEAPLADKARRALADLSAGNTAVVTGALGDGHAAEGPYDVIFVNGAVAAVPDALRNQLKPGGRLVAVVREGTIGQAVLVERLGDVFGRRVLFDAATPLLPGFQPAESFVF